MQDLLDNHHDNMNLDTQNKLIAVLRKSYERLPSNEHQLMFLDAALLLRGRSPSHLTALWEGQLLQKKSECENKRLRFRLLPNRHSGETRPEWQNRLQTASSGKAAEMLAYLEKLLLVRSEPFDKQYRRDNVR